MQRRSRRGQGQLAGRTSEDMATSVTRLVISGGFYRDELGRTAGNSSLSGPSFAPRLVGILLEEFVTL